MTGTCFLFDIPLATSYVAMFDKVIWISYNIINVYTDWILLYHLFNCSYLSIIQVSLLIIKILSYYLASLYCSLRKRGNLYFKMVYHIICQQWTHCQLVLLMRLTKLHLPLSVSASSLKFWAVRVHVQIKVVAWIPIGDHGSIQK